MYIVPAASPILSICWSNISKSTSNILAQCNCIMMPMKAYLITDCKTIFTPQTHFWSTESIKIRDEMWEWQKWMKANSLIKWQNYCTLTNPDTEWGCLELSRSRDQVNIREDKDQHFMKYNPISKEGQGEWCLQRWNRVKTFDPRPDLTRWPDRVILI